MVRVPVNAHPQLAPPKWQHTQDEDEEAWLESSEVARKRMSDVGSKRMERTLSMVLVTGDSYEINNREIWRISKDTSNSKNVRIRIIFCDLADVKT